MEVTNLPALANIDAAKRQIVEEILQSGDPETTQRLAAKHLSETASDGPDEDLFIFLKSIWNNCEGIKLIRRDGNFAQAKRLHEAAADGFKQLGAKELESIAHGFSLYCDAVVESRAFNFAKTQELFEKIDAYLSEAGQFGNQLEPLVEHFRPDALYSRAQAALVRVTLA